MHKCIIIQRFDLLPIYVKINTHIESKLNTIMLSVATALTFYILTNLFSIPNRFMRKPGMDNPFETKRKQSFNFLISSRVVLKNFNKCTISQKSTSPSQLTSLVHRFPSSSHSCYHRRTNHVYIGHLHS